MNKLRVGLVFGGRSQEHEISVMSAKSVYKMVDAAKYEIIPIAISKKGRWFSPAESQKILTDDFTSVPEKEGRRIADTLGPFLEEKLDAVFPLLHGPYGEDGKIQGFFDMLDLPYVGASVLGSALGMDKVLMKKVFAFHGLPQSEFRVMNSYDYNNLTTDDIEEKYLNDIGYPCFIKPANLGSSIGISKVHNSGELAEALTKAFSYDRKIVIEEHVNGREVECGVLGNVEVAASLPGEIIPDHEFYDYEAKYKDQSTRLVIPADIDEELISRIKKLAVKAFKAVDGQGFSRVDFFIREGDNEVLINEINTIPGFTQYSMYPKMWEASGISYSELIDKLIQLALEKD